VPTEIPFNGVKYRFPDNLETGWGQDFIRWARDVTELSLSLDTGLVELKSDLSFGPEFGIGARSFRFEAENVELTISQGKLTAVKDGIETFYLTVADVTQAFENSISQNLSIDFSGLNTKVTAIAKFVEETNSGKVFDEILAKAISESKAVEEYIKKITQEQTNAL
jgi:hypothetical protein